MSWTESPLLGAPLPDGPQNRHTAPAFCTHLSICRRKVRSHSSFSTFPQRWPEELAPWEPSMLISQTAGSRPKHTEALSARPALTSLCGEAQTERIELFRQPLPPQPLPPRKGNLVKSTPQPHFHLFQTLQIQRRMHPETSQTIFNIK